MKRYLFIILFLSIGFFTTFAQERDFYIEITPSKNVLAKEEIFTVVASIMNVTMKEQRLCSWSCSYSENWQLEDSSGKVHMYATDCDKNIVSCITLRPLERLEKELYLQVDSAAKKGNASFRLDFIPCISREECFETAKENQQFFRSQQVTIRIK
ncbi:MAG: hypothetical protein M0R48_01100 [Candidatus Omnitrophica bacterium]|jgi:hypothetical protein|nr:hypothetical protein [Candidatus Omnitrophota bacterium]